MNEYALSLDFHVMVRNTEKALVNMGHIYPATTTKPNTRFKSKKELTDRSTITLTAVELVQLFGRAQRRVHLRRLLELGVVHLVPLPLTVVRHQWDEPVSPHYFTSRITGTSLSRLTRRFYRSLQNNHNLEPLLQHIGGGHTIERTVGIYLMHHCYWPNEE